MKKSKHPPKKIAPEALNKVSGGNRGPSTGQTIRDEVQRSGPDMQKLFERFNRNR